MTSRKDRLCPTCGFPVRRGRVPIVWPDEGTQGDGRAAFCSLVAACSALRKDANR